MKRLMLWLLCAGLSAGAFCHWQGLVVQPPVTVGTTADVEMSCRQTHFSESREHPFGEALTHAAQGYHVVGIRSPRTFSTTSQTLVYGGSSLAPRLHIRRTIVFPLSLHSACGHRVPQRAYYVIALRHLLC